MNTAEINMDYIDHLPIEPALLDALTPVETGPYSARLTATPRGLHLRDMLALGWLAGIDTEHLAALTDSSRVGVVISIACNLWRVIGIRRDLARTTAIRTALREARHDHT